MTALFWLLIVILLLVFGLAVISTALWVLGYLLIGLIIGLLARLFVKNTQGIGLLVTSLAGIAGAILGGMASDYLAAPTLARPLIAIFCAALVLIIIPKQKAS